MFLGVIYDGLAIFFGGILGLLFNKGISERVEKSIMKAIAISAIYIAIRGMSSGENTIFIILSMVIGTIIGELLYIDDRINRFADRLASKLAKEDGTSTFSEGLITGSLIMGVGALSIIGPIESGLTGNHTIMFTNAVIDGITSIVLASSLGIGVVFSAFPVFIYEALIVIFAGNLNAFLTEVMINDMNAIGSLLVLIIGLNLLEITDIKVMNFVPALFVPMALFFLY